MKKGLSLLLIALLLFCSACGNGGFASPSAPEPAPPAGEDPSGASEISPEDSGEADLPSDESAGGGEYDGAVAVLCSPRNEEKILKKEVYIEYEYDERGNRVLERVRSGATYVYEYDENDCLVRLTSSGNSQLYDFTMEYEYDGIGRRMKSTLILTDPDLFGPEGKINEWSEYQYDDAGVLIRINWYRPGDEEPAEQDLAYDERGNLVSYTDILGTYLFEYDTEGNRISVSHQTRDSVIVRSLEYEYDRNGNITRQRILTGDGTYSPEWFEYYGVTHKVYEDFSHYITSFIPMI